MGYKALLFSQNSCAIICTKSIDSIFYGVGFCTKFSIFCFASKALLALLVFFPVWFLDV
jgi:hypothetical protein